MSDMSLDHVSENYMDVLKEIGNIGAGNAMTALAQMMPVQRHFAAAAQTGKVLRKKSVSGQSIK